MSARLLLMSENMMAAKQHVMSISPQRGFTYMTKWFIFVLYRIKNMKTTWVINDEKKSNYAWETAPGLQCIFLVNFFHFFLTLAQELIPVEIKVNSLTVGIPLRCFLFLKKNFAWCIFYDAWKAHSYVMLGAFCPFTRMGLIHAWRR